MGLLLMSAHSRREEREKQGVPEWITWIHISFLSVFIMLSHPSVLCIIKVKSCCQFNDFFSCLLTPGHKEFKAYW